MINGHEIAGAAMKWLGTPHVNGAKAKGYGVDCGMLLIAALEDSETIEKDSIKVQAYSNEWHLHRSEEWFKSYIEAYCVEVEPADIREGDFLLYQFGRCISHGGIYIGGGMIAHAVVGQGVILSDINDVMFTDAKGKSRLRGIYRFGGD